MTSKQGLRAATVLMALVLGASAAQADATYSFTELGAFSGPRSGALGLNGSDVAGGFVTIYHDDDMPWNELRAARWIGGGRPTDLGTLGGPYATANAINDANVIVGYSLVPGNYDAHATMWRDGQVIALPGLGGGRSDARAINQKGTAVGYSTTTGDKRTRAVVWKSGTVKALPGLGGVTTVAEGISSTGHIVGYGSVGKQGLHALLWKGSEMTDLGASFEGSSYAYGVNDAGQAVGARNAADGGYSRPTRWVGGQMSDLGTLGGDQGWAYAINKKGDIVGASSNQGVDQPRATLWSGGQVIDLNSVVEPWAIPNGWVLTEARAINQKGHIVGTMRGGDAEERAFLLKPLESPKR